MGITGRGRAALAMAELERELDGGPTGLTAGYYRGRTAGIEVALAILAKHFPDPAPVDRVPLVGRITH